MYDLGNFSKNGKDASLKIVKEKIRKRIVKDIIHKKVEFLNNKKLRLKY